jgi:hypothetical protein
LLVLCIFLGIGDYYLRVEDMVCGGLAGPCPIGFKCYISGSEDNYARRENPCSIGVECYGIEYWYETDRVGRCVFYPIFFIYRFFDIFK